MYKQAYLIVVFANKIQSMTVSDVKRVIPHVYIAPVMCLSFIAEYTVNNLKTNIEFTLLEIS